MRRKGGAGGGPVRLGQGRAPPDGVEGRGKRLSVLSGPGPVAGRNRRAVHRGGAGDLARTAGPEGGAICTRLRPLGLRRRRLEREPRTRRLFRSRGGGIERGPREARGELGHGGIVQRSESRRGPY